MAAAASKYTHRFVHNEEEKQASKDTKTNKDILVFIIADLNMFIVVFAEEGVGE
jgi:hypothetical protein